MSHTGFAVAALVVAVQPTFANEPVWTGFLGAGATTESATPPLTWSPDENIAWTADLPGVGQSTPVVSDGVAYLTQVIGENKETLAVIAVDLADGSEKWRYEVASSRPAKVSVYISLAAPSPVVDDEAVYAWFETGDFIALGHDGTVRWSKDLLAELESFDIRHGLAGSLVAVDDKVVVLIDQEGPSELIAVSKGDGEIAWRTARETTTAWSSPAVMTVGGAAQIVTSSVGTIAGYDPADGRELWRIDGVGGNTVPTPMPFADGRFLIGASGGRGGESTAIAAKTNGAYEVVATEDGFDARPLWTSKDAKTSFNSPAAYRGLGYWVNRVGALYCLDLESGDVAYKARVDCGSCWATPFGSGDRVYVPGRKGGTTVLAAGPEFEELASNSLWEAEEGGGPFGGPTVYAVAVLGDALLFRSGDRLFFVREDE